MVAAPDRGNPPRPAASFEFTPGAAELALTLRVRSSDSPRANSGCNSPACTRATGSRNEATPLIVPRRRSPCHRPPYFAARCKKDVLRNHRSERASGVSCHAGPIRQRFSSVGLPDQARAMSESRAAQPRRSSCAAPGNPTEDAAGPAWQLMPDDH